MNPVVHFEMPFEDQKRLSAFYKSAFGWKMKNMGDQMGDYVLATTTLSDPDGRPAEPGAINGGFFPKKPDWPDQYPSVVIGVGDIQKTMQKIAKAGGLVLGEPMDIPGVGQYVSFTDTEGNRVSILQPAPMEKPKPAKSVSKKKVVKKKTAAKKKVVAKKKKR